MNRYCTDVMTPFLKNLQATHRMRMFVKYDWRNVRWNLASNDYLCLARDIRLQEAAMRAMQVYGTSSSGSPVASSYLEIHEHLEDFLCLWLSFPSALLWNSGYQANYGILKYLPQANDIILADELMHYSALMGAVDGKGTLHRYRHNDYTELEALLQKYTSGERNVFVVNEALYSMDGDVLDFEKIKELKLRYKFIWILDEAHSVGWYGNQGAGLASERNALGYVDVMMFTFGKAIASQGAVTLFRVPECKDYMINSMKEIWYTTYLSPIQTSIATKAIEIIRSEFAQERCIWKQQAEALDAYLKPYLQEAKYPSSPIFPMILGDEETALIVQKNLLRKSIAVAAIRPPTVNVGTSRLRISLNREVDVELIAKILIEELSVYI